MSGTIKELQHQPIPKLYANINTAANLWEIANVVNSN
jgi:hypothetical protein